MNRNEISRRATLVGALAVPLTAGLPRSAFALTAEDALQRVLSKVEMPLPGTTLTLKTFEATRDGGDRRMTAVVEMIWPPGRRLRKFSEVGSSDQLALNALFTTIVAEFRAAAAQ